MNDLNDTTAAPSLLAAHTHTHTPPHHDPADSPLGRVSAYRDTYAPELLYPIERQPKRDEIGVIGALPFMGCDLWTAYELSWLNLRGKPQVALAQFTVPCESPAIVESKSFKLYLNSFNMSRFESADVVRELLQRDLSAAFGQRVGVKVLSAYDFAAQRIEELDGVDLDRLDLDCDAYEPAPELLTAAFDEKPVTETLTSGLLKSNCLVTGQPDWGSVQIRYSGPQIDQAGLLRYLVSFRQHNEFHEQCVERIYMDVLTRCKPVQLQVYARYTRRGGLDINPWRTSHPATPPRNLRTARQ
ncbi:NADPH-dependent 7-cyano-7-deazaguanine reductase QueF [Sphaerotilus mobilis]|nr:NADPH-dependent 7-cyano-7-deazaguanine reductase QueF [Sphaerotilus mobilis]